MKLLFDQNLSYRLCHRLDDLFPDSQQVRQINLDKADDQVVWSYARDNSFTLVTLDADFADIAMLRGAPPKIIWLRCGNQPVRVIEQILRRNFAQVEKFEAEEDATVLELY